MGGKDNESLSEQRFAILALPIPFAKLRNNP